MSDQEFERYLKVLGDLLRMNRSQRDAIAEELRDHFWTAKLDELLSQGVAQKPFIRPWKNSDPLVVPNNF